MSFLQFKLHVSLKALFHVSRRKFYCFVNVSQFLYESSIFYYQMYFKFLHIIYYSMVDVCDGSGQNNQPSSVLQQSYSTVSCPQNLWSSWFKIESHVVFNLNLTCKFATKCLQFFPRNSRNCHSSYDAVVGFKSFESQALDIVWKIYCYWLQVEVLCRWSWYSSVFL